MLTTFGHSTLEPEAAIALLDSAGVDVLIDVRSHPTSRWEQWRRENAERWIKEVTQGDIEYQWWPELGGWDVRHAENARLSAAMINVGVDLAAYSRGAFPKQRIAKQVAVVGALTEGAPVWTNQGLWDYAWFTATEEFQAGVDRLVAGHGRDDQPTAAIMCAECLWWKCHRSMIADVLVYRGVEAWHIQPRWSAHSGSIGNRLERYPAVVRESWERWPR